MEKDKMIEELEAILEQEQIKIANTVEEFTKLQKVGITRCNAEALYNANCRIVSEGSIVLSKEEYDDLQSEYDKVYKQAEADIHGNIADGGTSCHWCEDMTKRGTAKQSCNDLIKIIKNNTDLNASVFGWTTDFILNMIKTYFKDKYGVEEE